MPSNARPIQRWAASTTGQAAATTTSLWIALAAAQGDFAVKPGRIQQRFASPDNPPSDFAQTFAQICLHLRAGPALPGSVIGI